MKNTIGSLQASATLTRFVRSSSPSFGRLPRARRLSPFPPLPTPATQAKLRGLALSNSVLSKHYEISPCDSTIPASSEASLDGG